MPIINMPFYDSTEFCNFWCSAEAQLTDFNVFLVRCYAFYRISTKRDTEKNTKKPSVGREVDPQLQTFSGPDGQSKGIHCAEKSAAVRWLQKVTFFDRADSREDFCPF